MSIGKTGDKITPLSLLEINEVPSEPEAGNLSGAMSPKEIEYLFWVIVGSFRVMNFANSRRQDSSENVSLSIQGVLISSPFAVPKGKFGSFGLTYRNLRTATEFSVLMAALDMFLVQFPYHKYAGIRISTIVSRNKGCTVPISLIHVSKIMNVKLGVLATYIMGDKVAEELKKIFKDGEEFLDLHSYGH